MATLYDLKQKLAMVGAELQAASSELTSMAANPSVPIDEVKAQKEKVADLQTRFDLIKADHDQKQEAERKELDKDGLARAASDEERKIAAKAAFYRAVLTGERVPQDALEVVNQAAPLIAIPPGGGTGGEYLLPSQLESELIHEPLVRNPLRQIIRMSNVKGLEVPKIAFSIDSADDVFIGDADTAKELKATGSKVTFGRFKTKIYVSVSDTVVHGTDTNLVQTIEDALRAGLAAKEKNVSFAEDKDQLTGAEHMSFYQETTPGTLDIKAVTGTDMYEAITNAIADLHEDFRERASVVMRYADYVTIVKTLANNAADLFSAPPERVIGKPVIFSDAAVIPIVGDFGYLRLNYDGGGTIFDADKDVKKGEYIFVLTAWFDQWRLLNSAFRLAVVDAEKQ